jgi:hypothetical protein
MTRADMLKTPCNATGFYIDTHKCTSHSLCIVAEGWQASLYGHTVLLQAFCSMSALAIDPKMQLNNADVVKKFIFSIP